MHSTEHNERDESEMVLLNRQASRMDLSTLGDVAENAARQGAKIITDALHDGIAIAATKSTPTDLVTTTDRLVEARIVDLLLAHDPFASIIAEESGQHVGTSALRWIVDPIDGTTNFVYGISGFNISIAASLDDEVVAGVVFDPIRGECFRATRNNGAMCNGKPIVTRETAELAHALVGTGFSYNADRRRAQAGVVAKLIGSIRDIRRQGAAALDLCSVAAGRLDIYFESGLQPWDLAAGALIATEAGARVAGLYDEVPSNKLVIAAHPKLFDEFQAILRELDERGEEVLDPSA